MKQLFLCSFSAVLVGLVMACVKDVTPTAEITGGITYKDPSNAITVDQQNRTVTLTIGTYTGNNPRRSVLTLLPITTPNALVAQANASSAVTYSNMAPPNQGTALDINVAKYSNADPIRLRAIPAHSTGQDGIIYTLQVKAIGPLKIEGLYINKTDTLRLGAGNRTTQNGIYVSVSNLYNGSQPGQLKFYAVTTDTKEKITVDNFDNDYALDVVGVSVSRLLQRAGTYNIMIETPDGRTATSPFIVKVTP